MLGWYGRNKKSNQSKMLLERHLNPRMGTITMLYLLWNFCMLGQTADMSSQGKDNSTTTVIQMKQFMHGIVLRHTLNNIENIISSDYEEMANKKNVKENKFYNAETSFSTAINDNSNNELYYNSGIVNEVLSNYRHNQLEDQVSHLYDSVTSHPLFLKVLSKDAFHVLVAEVTRLTLVINSTSATQVQGDSTSQVQISDLVPTVNSELVSAVTELGQQLDIVEPVIHNVTSAMQVIMADDEIDEDAVMDLIHDILPDPDEDNLTKVQNISHASAEHTTIANIDISDIYLNSSSTTTFNSTNRNISSESINEYATSNSQNISSSKDNDTATEENDTTYKNNVTLSTKDNGGDNISIENDFLNHSEISNNLSSSSNLNKTLDLQLLDLNKLKPGNAYLDPYDPMSYLLALKSVYNQSNHIKNKTSASNGPSFSIPSEINKNSNLSIDILEIVNNEDIDIIEVPNDLPALLMSPGQYIESPLTPNEEETVTEVSKLFEIENKNVDSNLSQTIEQKLIEKNETDEISNITEYPNVNSSVIQNIKERDPTLFESAEMLIKTMTDSLSEKVHTNVNNTSQYDELNNNKTNINHENNNEDNLSLLLNNKRNESSNNAEYLLGMMQQSMTPKPTTEQPQSQHSVLNNFLSSWFKPILDYTNRTNEVISSLQEGSYEILKNNTIPWTNIFANNITKDTVKTEDTVKPNKLSEVNNHKQPNNSYGNNVSNIISVNNTVTNHVPAYPDSINLNINIYQNENQKNPSHTTLSSDIYDYYEYYDYEFPRKPRSKSDDNDSIITEVYKNSTTDIYTIESIDDTRVAEEVLEKSQDDNASKIETKGSILGIDISDLPDRNHISINEQTSIPPPKQDSFVYIYDRDNPLQFPRTTTVPPPRAINRAELLVSKTPISQKKKKTKTNSKTIGGRSYTFIRSSRSV